MSDDASPLDERLEGWKEIALFVKRDESTARRWEREEGLPVRRHEHRKRSSVYAYRRELEAWRLARVPEGARRSRGPRHSPVWVRLAVAGLILFGRGDGSRATAEARDPDSEALPVASPPTGLTVKELMRGTGDSEGARGPTGDEAFGVSGDGRFFVYTEWDTGDLVALDATTGRTRGFHGVTWEDDEGHLEAPVFSPDDSLVAYTHYGEKTRIEIDSVEGGQRRVVYEREREPGSIYVHDWHPSGRELLVLSQAEDRSWFVGRLDLEEGRLLPLVSLNWEAPLRASYSPDGRFIAYDSSKDGDRRIYLLSVDGSVESSLVGPPGQNDSPLWTPDGRHLLFRSDRAGRWDLYVVPMRDGRPAGPAAVVKPNLAAHTRLRAVTRDGRLLVHERVVASQKILLAPRPSGGSGTLQATALPFIGTTEYRAPAFTPDGKRLAYLAGAPGSQSIRIVDLDGNVLSETPLEPRFTVSVFAPVFSPDGETMVIRTYEAGRPALMLRSARSGTLIKAFSPVDAATYVDPKRWTRDHVYARAVSLETREQRLVQIDVDSERVVDSVELPKEARGFDLSPSAEHLVRPVASGWGPLVLRSLADGAERILTDDVDSRPVWDADSRHIFFRRADDPALYRLSVDTGGAETVVEDMKGLDLRDVSPDGSLWALEEWRREDSRIWAMEHFLPEVSATPPAP